MYLFICISSTVQCTLTVQYRVGQNISPFQRLAQQWPGVFFLSLNQPLQSLQQLAMHDELKFAFRRALKLTWTQFITAVAIPLLDRNQQTTVYVCYSMRSGAGRVCQLQTAPLLFGNPQPGRLWCGFWLVPDFILKII